jgi:iron complex transport system ATP-binding protein
MSMLSVNDLHFSFGPVSVLSGISFNVGEGVLCGLFGPNGCGKTTIFKCCLNFLKVQRGRVFINDLDVKNIKTSKMARLVAYVPQEHRPPFPFLVKEIVLMGRTPHRGGIFGVDKDDKEKAWEALDLLEITDLAEWPYNRLSGGQRQMVLIARAIAQGTELILLDEPTSALDFNNQIRIWRILRKIAEKGVTLLACSHDPNHVSWYCDQVIALDEKGILAQGAPSDVLSQKNMNRIYEGVCAVKKMGRSQMILPTEMLDL